MNASRLLPLTLIALVVVAFFLGLFNGRRTMLVELEGNPDSVHSQRKELEDLRAQLRSTQGQFEMISTRHEVDRQALSLVRQEMAEYKEHSAELEEGLRFYRSLMSGEDVENGLSLRQLQLVEGDNPRQYGFRIIALQEARKHEPVSGTISVEIVGLVGAIEVSYPLQELSEGYSEEGMALKFRYFQSLEGEFVLPEGLHPIGIRVTAEASKPRKMAVEQMYPWQLQEGFTNVGR